MATTISAAASKDVYCNEAKALITSMNMYEYSIRNNEEIGVLLIKGKEEKQYNQVINYLTGLIENVKSIKVNNVQISQYEQGLVPNDETEYSWGKANCR